MHTKLNPLPTLPLGRYRHYKGYEYEILAVGRLEATEEPVVIYKALYNAADVGPGAVWVRPVDDFLATVTIDGTETPRFTKIDTV